VTLQLVMDETIIGATHSKVINKIIEAKKWAMNKFSGKVVTKIVGINAFGSSQTAILDKFIDSFGEANVDELDADAENLGDDISKSLMIKKMIAVAKAKPEYFIKKVGN
jgi:hypothetical protein